MGIVFLLMMLLIACLTGIASDIYLPAIFDMATQLNTEMGVIQSSMAIFMFGVALSQLGWGPLSEGFGRKPILIIGLVIILIGNGVCVFAFNDYSLLLGRFIAGMGAGTCACLWRSVFRDCFNPEQMARYGAYLGIGMTFVIPAAPMVGAYLGDLWNWRANFVFLFLYALLLLGLMGFYFKESNAYINKSRLKGAFWKQSYGELLKSRIFMTYSLCVFITYGGFFSWFIAGPVLMMQSLGLSSIACGWVNFILGALAMTSAGFCNAKCVGKMGSAFMLHLGWGLVVSSAIFLLIYFYLFGLSLLGITFPAFIFLFGVTLIWPNAFAQAFVPFGHIAGYAGALYSFMQLGGAAFFGWLGSFFPHNNPIYLGCFWGLVGLLSLFIFRTCVVKTAK